MKYWTLFTLRMIARVGLSVAVILWAASQWSTSEWSKDIGNNHAFVGLNKSRLQLQLFRGGTVVVVDANEPDRSTNYKGILLKIVHLPPKHEPILSSSALTVWARTDHVGITIHHWLICLTFLIATVATSWRWKKPDVQTEEPTQEAVKENES